MSKSAGAAGRPEKLTIFNTLSYIYRENGIKGLYRGVTPRIGLGIWQTVCMVSFADYVKAWCVPREAVCHLLVLTCTTGLRASERMSCIYFHGFWDVRPHALDTPGSVAFWILDLLPTYHSLYPSAFAIHFALLFGLFRALSHVYQGPLGYPEACPRPGPARVRSRRSVSGQSCTTLT